MKASLLLFLIFLSSCVFSQNAISGNSEELFSKGLKLYELEKAEILYTVEGQPGDTIVTFFDRNGWRQLTSERGEKLYYGMKTKINTCEIKDGHTTITINLLDNKGKAAIDKTITDLASYKGVEELLEARMAKIQAVRVGNEIVLDKDCEVWTYKSRGKDCKIWTWGGIYLKHISPSGTQTAIEINLNPEIDVSQFIPPTEAVISFP